MPATYAHYRMGQQVGKQLDEKQRRVIEKYPQLYRIGFHGPDILFYYKPLSSNPVNQIGHELHDKSGHYFFVHARKVLREHPEDERYLAYVYGVLTHFVLDYSCHGYVEEKIQSSGISHTEIEVEFDRFLMEKDGIEPLGHLTSRHLAATKENAKIIAAFYPGTDPSSILTALRDMVLIHKILLCPGKIKRNTLYGLMKMVGCYDSMKDQIMKPEHNTACDDSNQELYRRFLEGRKLAVAMIDSFEEEKECQEKFDTVFHHNFCSIFVEGEE